MSNGYINPLKSLGLTIPSDPFSSGVNRVRKEKTIRSMSNRGGQSTDKASSNAMKKQLEAEYNERKIQEQKQEDYENRDFLMDDESYENDSIESETKEINAGQPPSKEEGGKGGGKEWSKVGQKLAATIVAAEEGRAKASAARRAANEKKISSTLSIFEKAADRKGMALSGLQQAMAGYFR